MSFVEGYLRRPHLLTAMVLLSAIVGIIGFYQIPINLFPDAEYPQIAVVTVYPGASSADVESEVSRTIEKELASLELVRRVSSTTKDEVSAVTVEFSYRKDLDAAATDVANALDRIRAALPAVIRPPMIFKISSATPPVMTLALKPAEGSPLDLGMVRQLADNEIRERLLRLPEVADVEVFGGHEPVVRIQLDRDRLEAHHLSAAEVRERLQAFNANQPIGLLIGDGEQLLLKRIGEAVRIEELGEITVARGRDGAVHLRDVAEIRRGEKEPQSAYHGNGEPAIAINIERALSGNALRTIADVAGALPELERRFPGIEFFVPDTQGDLIELSVGNMIDALRDAVIMTILVIFLFLADSRGAALAAISIPFTYVLTFAAMWLIGYEFNMVTLTAVIIAVGMLVDDAIVVLENIDRHVKELGQGIRQATIEGTGEVMLAVFSGTATSIAALVPIMFIGGYVQHILRPLTVSLTVALASSLVVSITVIPLLAPWLLRRRPGARPNPVDRVFLAFDHMAIDPLRRFYVALTARALRHRALFIVVGIV
ncbi:MAG: efflux RND transporter permease subunit, partial [Acidobacteria bacterium]